METENSTETLYSFIHTYELAKHEKNIRRIKLAIRYFFIIPMLLLAAMFFTGSSNIAFLLLWIVSLFGIAAYAIAIEYDDYELQKRMHVMDLLQSGVTDIEYDDLVLLPLINEKELLNSGIDRDNMRRMLAIFNRQKRMKRAKVKGSENTDAPDTAGAVATEEGAKEKPEAESAAAPAEEKGGSES